MAMVTAKHARKWQQERTTDSFAMIVGFFFIKNLVNTGSVPYHLKTCQLFLETFKYPNLSFNQSLRS